MIKRDNDMIDSLNKKWVDRLYDDAPMREEVEYVLIRFWKLQPSLAWKVAREKKTILLSGFFNLPELPSSLRLRLSKQLPQIQYPEVPLVEPQSPQLNLYFFTTRTGLTE
ncbi:hypothetical protein RDI58_007841 [Solanum bulbocastanum]|uniref:Uncharacterized protein n=1 Tax=Solanum bulbocastanum TaxID=147425 RepID=A0AAN8TTK8_SOLBU